jgi:hypothetical protein
MAKLIGYECECNEDCGLVFEDLAYEEALHSFSSEEKLLEFPTFSILHPDCKNVVNYTIIEQTEDYIVVQ